MTDAERIEQLEACKKRLHPHVALCQSCVFPIRDETVNDILHQFA